MIALLVVVIVFLVSYVFYAYNKKNFTYWRKKNVIGPNPVPVFGNFGNVILLRESLDQLMKRVYAMFPEEKVVGLYRGDKPVLLIRDPELIKQVLIKDFDIFQERGIRSSNDRLNDNLFGTEGETWRILRQKLTPTFTSGKLKNMVPLIQNCVQNHIKYVEELVENKIDHEIRSLMAKYTLDVIGCCAFGINVEAYSEKRNAFRDIAKTIFDPPIQSRVLQILDMIIPGIKNFFFMFETKPQMRYFFLTLVNNIIHEREGKPLVKKDFMDLMIELKEQGRVSRRKEDGISEIEIDNEMIAAQALVFYSAGFETSSATMSFLLHEIALNEAIQNRLYEEICKICDKYNGELNYESVNEMTYLNMVFDETLRKHSVGGLLLRKSVANYSLPGTDIIIEKGTPIMISNSGLHSDPKYFPNPDDFDPEKFSPENKRKIPQCAYIPFGEGPRNCIGMRFAKMQSMMGIAAFLKNFKVTPSQKTKSRLKYAPRAITLTSLDGIWMNITKR